MSTSSDTRPKRRLSKNQTLQIITGLLIAGLLVFFATAVVKRHLFAQEILTDTTPRYERLLGIQQSAGEMQSLTKSSLALLQAYAYPSNKEASQIGTDIQQKLRTVFAAENISIQSSQVLPEEEDGALMAIPVELRMEGDIKAISNALAALSAQRPLIQLRSINLQEGRKLNDNVPMLLTTQVKFFAWRERP